MAFPLLAVGGASALGFLFGKGGQGGFNTNISTEIGTKKEQNTYSTNTQTTTNQSFIDSRNFSIISNSPNASLTSSPSLSAPQTQQPALTTVLIPTQSGGSSAIPSGGSGTASPFDNLGNLLIIGGLLGGGILIVNTLIKKRK